MNGEDILKALSEIDDRYIEEAADPEEAALTPFQAGRKRRQPSKWEVPTTIPSKYKQIRVEDLIKLLLSK